jgi:phosphatidylserine/phosphatidylglycerophosphate/cardiolipin synthase-like enzyme
MHYQNRTLCRSVTSLWMRVERLCESMGCLFLFSSFFPQLHHTGLHPQDYLQFLSLRNVGMLGGITTTEQIYVHSKVTIVDDQIAYVGSANMNDRSLLGDRFVRSDFTYCDAYFEIRDSEIVARIVDNEQVRGRMNERRVVVSQRVRFVF